MFEINEKIHLGCCQNSCFFCVWMNKNITFFINLILPSIRTCISCGNKYSTSRGLDHHYSQNDECGKIARKKQKAERIKYLKQRKANIHGTNLRRIGPHKKRLSTPHRRGAPLSKEEKELVLHYYDLYRSKYSVEHQEFSANQFLREINFCTTCHVAV